ncbi:SDR family oxidoreductase [Flavobacterium sp. JP2137]|uniref:SDR family oxidoreductase n=1 Tax=Flavobacterium sp. JP2137 TaxID=3414510 RepID=UPI003D2FE6A4
MKKKGVLITGASRGIGLAIAQKLASQNVFPIGLARNTVGIDFPGALFSCDLLNFEQTATVLGQIAAQYDIYGVVNNVGVSLPQPLEALDYMSLQTVWDLNVRSAIQVTQFFVPGMKQLGYGRIVNICSRAIHGNVDRTAYSAAKSALIGCTKTWALEFAQSGITSNAVAPGPIETLLFRSSRPLGSQAEKQTINSVPMKRIGQPREVAAAVCFFLAEEAGFITGQVLGVDGGASIAGKEI